MRVTGHVCLTGLLGLALAGCQDTAPAAPDASLAPTVYAKRDGVGFADATVAVVSLEGAPEGAAEDFRVALARDFAARGVVAADGGRARYRLRVYLSASPAEGGASLDAVVDAFDAKRVRLARLSESFDVKGSGDAWSQITAPAIEAAAGACAEEVAAFLSNTPEAKPTQALSYVQ